MKTKLFLISLVLATITACAATFNLRPTNRTSFPDAITGSLNATNIFGTLTNDTTGFALTAVLATNAINAQLATVASRLETGIHTNTTTPNFLAAYAYSVLTTNAAFTFLAPVNVSATDYQVCIIGVTNTTGVAIAITAPANVHFSGTMNCTNFSMVTFYNWAGKITNMTCVPVF